MFRAPEERTDFTSLVTEEAEVKPSKRYSEDDFPRWVTERGRAAQDSYRSATIAGGSETGRWVGYPDSSRESAEDCVLVELERS